MTTRPTFSVVAPVHDEQECLPELYRRVKAVMSEIGRPWEILLVDDGSTDDSVEIIRSLAAEDPAVRAVLLSRNFGHQMAVTAGLHHARGEAVIVMDADLQDPPEVIPQLVERWAEGFQLVAAVRTERLGDARLKRMAAAVFYRLLRRLSDTKVAVDSGDFRLLDRRVVDVLNEMPERNRFVRGLSSWVGFRQTAVTYQRASRFAGRTKYPWRKLSRLATNALTSFSDKPLQLATFIGLLVAALGLAAVPVVVALRLLGLPGLYGQTSVLITVLIMGGLQLIAIGILGAYVGRLYEEVKGRPLYVVAETIPPSRPSSVAPAAEEAVVR